MIEARPSTRMRDLGVVQQGAGNLAESVRPFTFPDEGSIAEHVLRRLFDAMDRIATVHDFSGKGMGLAAPQIGIDRAAAAVRPANSAADPIVLFNPRVTAVSDEMDEQYEGCLSFFDVRGLVPRPLRITVETTALDGRALTTVYERGLARLIQHEIDHLYGLLYTDRMPSGRETIPVERYRQTGRAWSYER